VDDHPTNRRVLEEYLSRWGVSVTSVEGGLRALEIMRNAAAVGQPFDAALLDEGMPEMDGMSLAKAIKACSTSAGTQLILLSSYGKRMDDRALAAIGVEAFLSKPLRRSKLYDCLATVLGARGKADAAQGGPRPGRTVSVETPSGGALPNPAPNGIPVLLVEDNHVNQMVAKAMMEKLGYLVELAGNGREAVEAVALRHYAVILMDCQMPEMDGYEATRTIREREASQGNAERGTMNDERGGGAEPSDIQRSAFSAHRSRRVPIIAMTANAMKGDREKCLQAGMDDYVAKPIKKEALAAMLKKWTEPASASDTMCPAA
jgi:CheY-like chemotaxis protein